VTGQAGLVGVGDELAVAAPCTREESAASLSSSRPPLEPDRQTDLQERSSRDARHQMRRTVLIHTDH
jgi:hypothetical protein